jgi:hypothetical protein
VVLPFELCRMPQFFAMNGRFPMPLPMEQKSRNELDALSLEVAKRQIGCRGTERVTIRRLPPNGSGPNWAPDKFYPPLPDIADGEARDAIANLTGRYALADDPAQ